LAIDRQRIEQFGHLEFLANQVVEGFITGLHKSPFHGFSVEFAEHRLYNTGESTRHIDWKLAARTDKLFVKRYEEETNLRCHIVIDTSSSMYYPEMPAKSELFNKIKFSAYSAASILQLMRKQRDAVGLSFFSESVELHTPAKSSSVHHAFLYDKLEKMLDEGGEDAQRKSFAVDALHEIAEKVHRRSLVVIFSDMLDNSEDSDELFNALQHLRHNKHEVILFHVVDKKKELDFEFDNRPYTFVDIETGEQVKLNPNQVKDVYTKQMDAYKHELKMKCGQYRIDFVEADISEGFNTVLMEYLIKRQRMY
jgi:uncharacterized protein (DUF58 family)